MAYRATWAGPSQLFTNSFPIISSVFKLGSCSGASFAELVKVLDFLGGFYCIGAIFVWCDFLVSALFSYFPLFSANFHAFLLEEFRPQIQFCDRI